VSEVRAPVSEVNEAAFYPGAAEARLRRISPARWALWYSALFVAMLIFYVLLTPFWIGLRAAAWVAEFRARRRPTTT
jgi:hypothetical protein